MGTALTGQDPASTYKDLIHLDQSNAGVSSSLAAMADGNGTTLPLLMSDSAVDVNGQLTADGCYGELYGTSGTITVTTAGTYYGWTDATEGEISGAGFVTSDVAHVTADQLIIGAGGGGVYQVTVTCSFSGTVLATVIGRIHVTGSPDSGVLFVRKLGAGGDVGSASASGLITLASTDTVDFRVTSDSDGDSITIHACALSIVRIN